MKVWAVQGHQVYGADGGPGAGGVLVYTLHATRKLAVEAAIYDHGADWKWHVDIGEWGVEQPEEDET